MHKYAAARIVAGLALLGSDAAFSGVAAADILPEGTKVLIPSVTFTAPTQSLLVAYPVDCMIGHLDLKLNPGLRFAHNYDVLEPNVPRQAYKFCDTQTQIYALDAAAFPKSEASNPPPAWRYSKWNLAALDEIPIDRRDAFFASSPHVHRLGYVMPPFSLVRADSPLSAVTEAVTVRGTQAESVKLTYVYTDGTSETHTYAPEKRPQPSRRQAQDWMPGLLAGPTPHPTEAPAPGSAAAVPGPPARTQRGCGCAVATRGPQDVPALWAGLGCLVLLAAYRRRSSDPGATGPA
jgi:hypothetical protein